MGLRTVAWVHFVCPAECSGRLNQFTEVLGQGRRCGPAQSLLTRTLTGFTNMQLGDWLYTPELQQMSYGI